MSASIVNPAVAEFDIESFAAEEKMLLDGIEADKSSKSELSPLQVDSTGPVAALMDTEGENEPVCTLLSGTLYPYLHMYLVLLYLIHC